MSSNAIHDETYHCDDDGSQYYDKIHNTDDTGEQGGSLQNSLIDSIGEENNDYVYDVINNQNDKEKSNEGQVSC